MYGSNMFKVFFRFSIVALAEDERKKLDEKEALEEKKREEAERKIIWSSHFKTTIL